LIPPRCFFTPLTCRSLGIQPPPSYQAAASTYRSSLAPAQLAPCALCVGLSAMTTVLLSRVLRERHFADCCKLTFSACLSSFGSRSFRFKHQTKFILVLAFQFRGPPRTAAERNTVLGTVAWSRSPTRIGSQTSAAKLTSPAARGLAKLVDGQMPSQPRWTRRLAKSISGKTRHLFNLIGSDCAGSVQFTSNRGHCLMAQCD